MSQGEYRIGTRVIGPGNPAFIIAEAGVNHDGSMEKAKRLIDEAKFSGADAVKFQSFVAERVIRFDAPKAKYQDRNIGPDESQFSMLKRLELSKESCQSLSDYAQSRGILFISTAYDDNAVDDLESIGVPAHKLASIEVVNHMLIRKVARTGKPVILSVGMANEGEVLSAVSAFKDEVEKYHGNTNNLILLQCNTNYPANMEDQNLNAIVALRKFVPIVDFSDHTSGEMAAILSIALGANIIEKHFTLNKNDFGPDHKASMEPGEFSRFVKSIRIAEACLGNGRIYPRGGELENITGMRRSLCAGMNIPEGTVITWEMLSVKRPGDGIYATDGNLLRILGRKTKREILCDENITFNDID